jgi:hypothetical protein
MHRGSRQQAVALITIGLAMLAVSNSADRAVEDEVVREGIQFLVIAGGIGAAAVIFRRRNSSEHRE